MIVFTSRTGNVRNIVTEKLDLPHIELSEDLTINQPFVLFTYTDGLGKAPQKVIDFLNRDAQYRYCKGVVSSGNVNFGANFCKSADVISEMFDIPILGKLDLRGQQYQLDEITEKYNKIME